MADEQFAYQDLLEYIVKGLVDHPDDVSIERKVDEMGVLLILRVHADDMGQLIGKEGSTARAIRTLIRILGLKNHARVNLKIEEPEGGRVPAQEKKTSTEESLEDLKL
ncbi:KH domain-containing protein [Patescibacteria group bacterium]|nr:KH domain-containing protein [Patescibacteria group bacterium]